MAAKPNYYIGLRLSADLVAMIDFLAHEGSRKRPDQIRLALSEHVEAQLTEEQRKEIADAASEND